MQPSHTNHSNNHSAPATQSSCSTGDKSFEPLLDSEEAAALLKIHPKTLQKLARRGEITAIQIGKLWRFRASALNEWVEKSRSKFCTT